MVERRNSFKILIAKPLGSIPLLRHKRRRNDDIKIDLIEVDCDDVN